ncbi:5-carboxymethyl-2-hydroxymuconate isomerase [Azospirillum lipoferum]|uniref:5-carboxymethyl-2-hydroxymuconate Delta-isomerase n=1 Tax=Azospirillum lipoferum TaxID=193 RepID=A0A5A9GCF7_AZOLI|nr:MULTISPECIES: 5-carboxymethyl-2-hydroxymuconate Delta-isomerase [Azospirillum]KAA0592056.1 5-carboxymethyl-2-hydroxymuconate Delta-isomerase [Azospirillum lipoferum]MCP1612064.1 5-carboxymethyl-2-hydroxymuconate isomerase [Azospirillum lipoferum]MDW5536708.1 5-carboxymethyl-2-hydroxymuconate Delta-isomerase [Azospirillum sp. NL1]
MPHLTVEYTGNLGVQADIPALLRKANAVLIAQGGVFPTGGIRSRAIRLDDFCVADGTADDAFVHLTLKIGAGRSAEQQKKTGDELFAMVRDHFAALFASRFLALSLEIQEFSEAGTWKHNNIHGRYKAA